MLSVLIPIFNYHPINLVKRISEQCVELKIPFEIRCYDDFSDESFRKLNKSLEHISGVIYRERPNNLGRSKLRNLMSSDANYQHILFIDCDMAVNDDKFISRYLEVMNDSKVVFGGLTYSKKSKDPHRTLRWKYGSEREAVSAKNRRKKPWISIKTCNLLIDKSVFKDVTFSEKLYGYGYEDTLFGIHLQRNEIPVTHIDNPLVHLGIEDNEVFLEKAKEASEKLAQLLMDSELAPYLKEMRIVKYYLLEKKLKLDKISLMKFKAVEKTIISNLKSKNPSLAFFDFYKLICLIRAMNNQATLL